MTCSFNMLTLEGKAQVRLLLRHYALSAMLATMYGRGWVLSFLYSND